MGSRTFKNPASGHTFAKADKNIREQLLDATAVLFAEQGIAATTVAEIAARVGVTSAMIHYYFKTRDQLLDVIIEERIKPVNTFVWDPVTGDEDDPIGVVKGLVTRIFEVAELMPWLPPLWIREIVNEGGLLREKMLQHVPLDKPKKFIECIAAGQKRGVVNPDIDSRLLFMSLIGLTMLPLATSKIWDRIPTLAGVSKDDLARHVTALLIHGLANPYHGSALNGD